ncbi:hypothetical protein [Psychrobacter sp. AOP31-A1-22]|uniref:hypothetical protein n=1 Tax=Psychrobacter sp. AOP31-A1-22 TaxID=3457696 RepID=UPI0040358096
MKISLIKHFRNISPGHLKLGCADGCHHLVVVGVESSDASFNVFYKNQDTPYKVKQLSGSTRDLTEEEFESSNSYCHEVLLSTIEKTLAKVDIYQEIADLIESYTGVVNRRHNLLLAVKVYMSDSHNEMHYHLTNMLQTTDEVIENIIKAVCFKIPNDRLVRYN